MTAAAQDANVQPSLMDHQVTYSTTADVSMAAIARAVDDVWQEVFYPTPGPARPGTTDAYAYYCRVENIDVAHSIQARDGEGRIVGIATMGIRGDKGYCGDLGVVPEARRKGVGHGLMRAFVEEARRLGLRYLSLSVNSENVPALRIYEGAGFRISRDILILSATRDDLRLTGRESDITVTSPDPTSELVVRWFSGESTHPPCWWRDLPALLAHSKKHALVSERNGRETACLFYRLLEYEYVSPLHFGLTPEARIEDVGALLAASVVKVPATSFLMDGEPRDSRVHHFLRDLGFTEAGREHEMVLGL